MAFSVNLNPSSFVDAGYKGALTNNQILGAAGIAADNRSKRMANKKNKILLDEFASEESTELRAAKRQLEMLDTQIKSNVAQGTLSDPEALKKQGASTVKAANLALDSQITNTQLDYLGTLSSFAQQSEEHFEIAKTLAREQGMSEEDFASSFGETYDPERLSQTTEAVTNSLDLRRKMSLIGAEGEEDRKTVRARGDVQSGLMDQEADITEQRDVRLAGLEEVAAKRASTTDFQNKLKLMAVGHGYDMERLSLEQQGRLQTVSLQLVAADAEAEKKARAGQTISVKDLEVFGDNALVDTAFNLIASRIGTEAFEKGSDENIEATIMATETARLHKGMLARQAFEYNQILLSQGPVAARPYYPVSSEILAEAATRVVAKHQVGENEGGGFVVSPAIPSAEEREETAAELNHNSEFYRSLGPVGKEKMINDVWQAQSHEEFAPFDSAPMPKERRQFPDPDPTPVPNPPAPANPDTTPVSGDTSASAEEDDSNFSLANIIGPGLAGGIKFGSRVSRQRSEYITKFGRVPSDTQLQKYIKKNNPKLYNEMVDYGYIEG